MRELGPIKIVLALVVLLCLAGCDPVHDLKLENQTGGNIEIFFTPYLNSQQIGEREVERIIVGNQEINKISLGSGETIRIGTVPARYIPSAMDIDLDYLEIRYKGDTIKLTGKNAILSTIQKVEKLDWRIIIK